MNAMRAFLMIGAVALLCLAGAAHGSDAHCSPDATLAAATCRADAARDAALAACRVGRRGESCRMRAHAYRDAVVARAWAAEQRTQRQAACVGDAAAMNLCRLRVDVAVRFQLGRARALFRYRWAMAECQDAVAGQFTCRGRAKTGYERRLVRVRLVRDRDRALLACTTRPTSERATCRRQARRAYAVGLAAVGRKD